MEKDTFLREMDKLKDKTIAGSAMKRVNLMKDFMDSNPEVINEEVNKRERVSQIQKILQEYPNYEGWNQDYLGLDMSATHSGPQPTHEEHERVNRLNREEKRIKNFGLIKKLFPEETKSLSLENFKLNCWKGSIWWGDEDVNFVKNENNFDFTNQTSAEIIQWILDERYWELKTRLEDYLDNEIYLWKNIIQSIIQYNDDFAKEEGWDKGKIIMDTKNFIVEEGFNNLLKNTKCSDSLVPRKLPFNSMFINKEYTQIVKYPNKPELPIFNIGGIIILNEMISYKNSQEVEEKYKFFGGMPNILINLTLFDEESIAKKERNSYLIKFPQHSSDEVLARALFSQAIYPILQMKLDKHAEELLFESLKQIRDYVNNILDFINHPEIEYIVSESHSRNDLRVRRGQIPLPSKYNIILKEKFKRYISETISNNEKAWELGHKFWVRGHWMEFRNECYKNMQGKKKWILPYIKGKGELIKKDYYIGEKEQCWENQKRMIKLVQELFPDKKIIKNDRTTLEGLEIDCYLPELKLGFEYNGQQHYEHIEVFHKTKEDFEAQKERDVEKNKRAIEKGIKLITIKYDEPLTQEHLTEVSL
jgi:hypothetical protein